MSAYRIIELGPLELALAAGLVVAVGLLSVALKLRLEAKLAVASLRTVVQLVLVGFVLSYIFDAEGPWLLVLALSIMIAAAGRAGVRRASRRFPGVDLGAFLALALSATATTFFVTQAVIGVDPWYSARYVIPLMGMVLGNCLTGISLCLDTFLESLSDRRAEVESELALGATRWEAARAPLVEAVRRGMIPILNSMTVAGVVSLPGMMTGQILQGADPLVAVSYQVVVMFMIAAGTALGCILIALYTFRRLFNERHQLRAERISPRAS